MTPVTIYDTTLRDGTQGTGISFSTLDKIRVAEKLDDFGVHYIEGGWPGSNPKDAAFFEEAAKRTWKNREDHRLWHDPPRQDEGGGRSAGQNAARCETPAVTIVGKTWPLHVTEVFQVTLEENLAMIADTVAYLKKHGREVLYDAEHFFDSFKEDPEYSLKTVKAAQMPARISSCSVRRTAARCRSSSKRHPQGHRPSRQASGHPHAQ
jgi:2-isopropylmalate synthase